MQLDLFEMTNSFKNDTGQYKCCKRCNEELPDTEEFFYVQRRTLARGNEITAWLSNTCKKCSLASRKLRREMYRDNDFGSSNKTGTCDCCGDEDVKLKLDHCHETDAFRGWLCDNCNTGIGRLGDNLEGVLRAVDYLSRET